MKPTQINTQSIQHQLQELAGDTRVKVKLDKSAARMATETTDSCITCKMNPAKLRTMNQLNQAISFFEKECGGLP